MMQKLRLLSILLAATTVFPAAKAQIVYTNPADLTAGQVYPTYANNYIFVDMGTGGAGGAAQFTNFDTNIADFQLFWDGIPANPQIGLAGPSQSHLAYDGATGFLKRFNLNDTIDSSVVGTVSSNPIHNLNFGGANNANWAPGTTGYIGLTFVSDSTTVSGWMQISYNLDGSLTLYDFAYDASGASIMAGATTSAVPEPSTYAAMFGLTALGFAAYRRRRRQAA